QTTVSRHRPSSGAADLVYLAFPSTQLPQNSGFAPSFETASTHQQRFLRLIRGEPVELLPPVDSMEPLWSDTEKAAVENRLRAAIVGSDATVRVGLEKLLSDTHAD